MTTRMFEVWMEGCLATGMEGVPTNPQLIGTVEATSFQEACDIVGMRKKWKDLYESETRSIWGCRLYDSLEGAEQLFKNIRNRHRHGSNTNAS
jgi:hypothetical protein